VRLFVLYVDKTVQQLFEEQAARAPDRIAVCFHNAQIQYGELNARANRLAHYLSSHAVSPGSRVAVCLERSIDIVIALIATLKAGAAYVPLSSVDLAFALL
jgi:non-ribosomal peptide synthetase component F